MRYNRLLMHSVLVLLFIPLMVSCGQKKEEPQVSVPAANVPEIFQGEEKPLVAKLFEMWTKKGHVASIDQAAAELGVTVSDSVRADLFKKFKDNLAIHERLQRYRANTFVLSNEEKFIAENIVAYEKKHQEFPTLEQLATATQISADRLTDRLKFLASLEMFFDLGAPDEYNKLGFSYGHKFSEFTYDLGTRIHEFRVDGGKPFNVGCAKEALVFLNSEYPSHKVEYKTYDPVTLEPIHVFFENDEIKSVTPETARLLEGGTCGTNNLFANEGSARAYAATMPKFQNTEPPIFDVKVRFEDVKKQAAEGK